MLRIFKSLKYGVGDVILDVLLVIHIVMLIVAISLMLVWRLNPGTVLAGTVTQTFFNLFVWFPKFLAMSFLPLYPYHRAAWYSRELNREVTPYEALTADFGDVRHCVEPVGIDTRPSFPWGDGERLAVLMEKSEKMVAKLAEAAEGKPGKGDVLWT